MGHGDWEIAEILQKSHSWLQISEYLREEHRDLWAELPPCYWLVRLVAEMGELAAAIADEHEHPWELEAAQIAAIAQNMLRHHGRGARRPQNRGGENVTPQG